MTPYELYLRVQFYSEQRKNESEERISIAYMTASWAAQWFSKKKPSSLKKILGKEDIKKKMTPEEILEQVRGLNSVLGGTTY